MHQLSLTKANFIIVHPNALSTAIAAAQEISLPLDRIVLIVAPDASTPSRYQTISELIVEGLKTSPHFAERVLKRAEARTKIAFFCLSSGTTGKPKAVIIPHYSVIANTVQASLHSGGKYQPGDIISGSNNNLISESQQFYWPAQP